MQQSQCTIIYVAIDGKKGAALCKTSRERTELPTKNLQNFKEGSRQAPRRTRISYACVGGTIRSDQTQAAITACQKETDQTHACIRYRSATDLPPKAALLGLVLHQRTVHFLLPHGTNVHDHGQLVQKHGPSESSVVGTIPDVLSRIVQRSCVAHA